jgi:hypothetical protein
VATSITLAKSALSAGTERLQNDRRKRAEAEQMLADDEAKQLDAVVISLVERFPAVGEERIRHEVQDIAEGLADAKVRNFIPLLVDHAARDRLRLVATS